MELVVKLGIDIVCPIKNWNLVIKRNIAVFFIRDKNIKIHDMKYIGSLYRQCIHKGALGYQTELFLYCVKDQHILVYRFTCLFR